MNEIDVSIILVNYKNYLMTNDAVNSVIEKSKKFIYEIIVVDNSNDDCEFEKLEGLLEGKALCINAKENLGFGKANNLAVRQAKGKYVYFLNNDTLLINNAIWELLQYLKSNPNVGIVGSNLYTLEGKPNHSFGRKEVNVKTVKCNNSLFNLFKTKVIKRRNDFNYSNKPQKINGYVCGASLMIRRDYFNSLGGFDKDIFMYYEETLLCYRLIHELHLEIYNVPSSKIIHFEKKGDVSEKMAKISVAGGHVYFEKVFGLEAWKNVCKSFAKSLQRKITIASILHIRNFHYEGAKRLKDVYEAELDTIKKTRI